MKRLNRPTFLVILLFCGLLLQVTQFASTQAQNENSPTNGRLVFQPYGNQNFVGLNKFPQIETKFLLQENGRPLQGRIDVGNFKIYEDGREIEPTNYSVQQLPIHMTVIVMAETDQDLPKTDDPTRESWGQLIWDLTPNDSFRLCFTIGLPSCEPKRDREDFDAFFESMRKRIIKQASTLNHVTVSDLLTQALTDAEMASQTPVIILIRDEGVYLDSTQGITLGIIDGFLDRLHSQGGVFILIDEINNPFDGEQLSVYLESKDAHYYSAYGVPDQNAGCEIVSDCIGKHISDARPLQHVVEYQSLSFPDHALHELIIEFYPDREASPISATTTFSFQSTKAASSIPNYVRYANSILAVSAPFLLMLVLVLSIGPRESKT
jgi:hypothetical protein